MSATPDHLSAARERVAAVYDPSLLEEAGHRLAGLLAANLSRAERSEGSVLPWAEPPEAVREARAFLGGAGAAAAGAGAAGAPGAPRAWTPGSPGSSRRCSTAASTCTTRATSATRCRRPCRWPACSTPSARSPTRCMAIYEMGPWATAVEQAMVEELGEAIGWAPGSFSGAVTHGGSLANLTGLLTARNVALGEAWDHGLAAEARRRRSSSAHADAHYSVARAAGILGLGSRQIVRVGLDAPRTHGSAPARRGACAAARRRNRPIVAVVACACATPIGAFDPLEEIADVCRRHGVWLHVDAAHGGAACSATGIGTWWPGSSRPTASSGTPTRCSSSPACAPSSSTATSATASRPSSRTRPTCSTRPLPAWPSTTAACGRSSAPSGRPPSGCGACGRCSGGSSSPTWST